MNRTFMSLAGRRVVVTGGTRGIGRGIARGFARAGARVLVVGRTDVAARSTVEELGDDVSYVLADVSKQSDCRRMAAAALDRMGGVDVLCANAGIYPLRPIDDLGEDDITEMLGTNLSGCLLSVQACLPALRKSGRGRIVLTSSMTGPITGLPAAALYGASKAGQLGFMRSAALELAPDRITVNAVLPGSVMTEELAASVDDRWIRAMEAAIPLGRLATVDDIAHAVLYLASDEAAYVTGQTLVVDGGVVLPEPAPQ
jgi:3-oxoacyl-[acyl-carrier protein] reductase